MKAIPVAAAACIAAAMLVGGCQTPQSSEGTAAPSKPAAAPASAPAESARPGMPESAAPAAADAPAHPAPATSMSVEDMQKRLVELGYQPGTPDGKSGPRTVNALKKFQQDHHLPVTGRLDAETTLRLQQGK